MTHVITFDVFQYAKNLQKSGFTEGQVEAQVEFAKAQVEFIKKQTDAINDLIDGSLATKVDIKRLEERIALSEERTSERMASLEERISERMKNLGLRMTIALGSIMVSGLGLLVVLMKLFKL
jgi:flagellar motility protein MotE (MotC chaperone)